MLPAFRGLEQVLEKQSCIAALVFRLVDDCETFEAEQLLLGLRRLHHITVIKIVGYIFGLHEVFVGLGSQSGNDIIVIIGAFAVDSLAPLHAADLNHLLLLLQLLRYLG